MSLFLDYSYFQKLLVLLLFLLLQSCSEDWAKRMEYGVAIPDARIKVTLLEPSSKYDLFSQIQDAARLGGFPRLNGTPLSERAPNSQKTPNSFSFGRSRGTEDVGYSINFMLPNDVEMPREFIFVFHNATTNSFTEKEWLIFNEWYERFLPTVFPDAAISITRHPADATDTEDLMNISESTGISLPEADRKRYEKTLSANN